MSAENVVDVEPASKSETVPTVKSGAETAFVSSSSTSTNVVSTSSVLTMTTTDQTPARKIPTWRTQVAGQDVNMNVQNAPNASTTTGGCLVHGPCAGSGDADLNPAPKPEPESNPEPNPELSPDADATVGDHSPIKNPHSPLRIRRKHDLAEASGPVIGP